MKYSKIRQILPLCTLLMATVMWAQEPQYQMSSDPLEIRGDSVILTLDITIPDDQVFDKHGTYVITPKLGMYKFPDAEISVGRDGPFRGTTVTKSFIVPLKSGMFGSGMLGKELKVKHLYVYGDQEKKFDDVTGVAECCITTGNLYVMNAQFDNLTTVSRKTKSTQTTAATAGEKATYTTGGTGDVTSQEEPVLVVGQINFPVDNAQLASDRQGDHINAIGEFLQQYPDAKIEIHGYASPEGPYARNTELARQRASTTKKWLVTQLNDKGYSAYVDHANIHVSSTSEDWEGFRYIVQRAGLSDEERQRILEITDAANATALDAKEGQIFTAGNGNDPLEPQLRPLRRTTIMVSTDATDLSMAEVANVYSVNNASDDEIKKVCLDGKVLNASQMTHATEGKVTMMSSFHAKGAHQDKMAQSSKSTQKKHAAESRQMQEPAEEPQGQRVVVAESKETQQSEEGVVITDESSKKTTDAPGHASGNYEQEKYVFQISDIEDITAYDIQTKGDYVTNVTDEEQTLDEDFKVSSIEFRAKGKGLISEDEYTLKFRNDLVTLEKDLQGAEGVTKAQVANNLGAVYIAMGETEVARGYLEQAYEISPDAAAVNYNLQLYYLAHGNFEKALWHADRAKTIEGSSYNRALALLMTGHTDKSISELYQFVNAYPKMAAGHYLMAIAAARSGEPALMSKHLSRAVNLNPALGDVAARDLEFRAYWKDDMFTRATVASR